MSQVLEILPNGRAVPFRHAGAVLGVVNAAIAKHGPRTDALDRYRVDSNAVRMRVMAEQAGVRTDAFNDGGGLHLPRQLEHIHQRVLEEKRPVPNGLSLFRISNEVPVGARTHTVRRFLEDGEAAVYRGGTEVPRVGVSQVEEEFPVRHYVTSFATNHFEMLSSGFANTNEAQRKMRSARRIMESFINRMTWGIGSNDAHGVYGVLNYPWLAKKIASVLFDGSAAVNDVLAELQDAANYPSQQSKSVFMPNRCVTSTRVRDYLMNTRLGSVNDTTIGEFFTRNNEHIDRIEGAWELRDIAGAGVDGILFYNDSEDGITNEMVQGLTPLPIQSFGFEDITYLYASHGGVIMRDAGNNILLLVTAVP